MEDVKVLDRIQEIMRTGNTDQLTAYLNELLQEDCTQAMRILHKLGMRPTMNIPTTKQDDEKSPVN